MAMEELPKKILLIKECTFFLPDNFNGSVEEAFTEFLKYREANLDAAKFADPQGLFSTFNILMHSKDDVKVCGEYGLYELTENGYTLVDGTRPF